MILLESTDTLRIVLAGAVSTNQAILFASYADMLADASTLAPSRSSALTNNTTSVNWVESPDTGDVRQVKYLSLFNADTATITATISFHDGTNTRTLIKVTLLTGERLGFLEGFQVYAADGSPKGNASLTDGDYGDITVSSNGTAMQIDAGAVGTAEIADANVTKAKLDAGARFHPIQLACSDESTALTTGTAKITFRTGGAYTVTGVRASLSTAQSSGSIFTVDINEGGTTILSTKLTIDNGEKTSTTAATPAVVSDASLADDAEITVDIDQIGDGTAKGLKVTILGYYT